MPEHAELQLIEHHKVPLLSNEQVMEVVQFLDGAEEYVARLIRKASDHTGGGNRIRVHRVVPIRNDSGIVVCKHVLDFVRHHKKLSHEAGYREHVSLLVDNPDLVKPGFISPVLGTQSDSDHRLIVLTCEDPGQILVDVRQIKSKPCRFTWAAHQGLTFAAVGATPLL